MDPVDIAVVVEGLEERGDFLALGVGEFGVVLGAVAEFGGGDGPTGGFEGLGDVIEFSGLGEEASGDGVGREVFEVVGGEDFEVIGAGFDGGAFWVGAFRGVCFDETDVVEHPCDGSHGTGAEEDADFGAGAVIVFGEALDENGDAVRGEAFEDDGFDGVGFAVLAGAFGDGAFDGVAVDALFFSGFDGCGEARIEFRAWAGHACGDLDFAH